MNAFAVPDPLPANSPRDQPRYTLRAPIQRRRHRPRTALFTLSRCGGRERYSMTINNAALFVFILAVYAAALAAMLL